MNKILILHTSTVIGGAEYSLKELLHNKGNFPVELHIVISPQQEFSHLVAELPVCCHNIRLNYLKKNWRFTSIAGNLITLLSASVKLLRLIKKLNISIVYCNTFRTLPYCLLIKWYSKARIVCHCRDNISSRQISKWMSYIADEFIAVSSAIYKQLPPSPKTSIVYNGVNPAHFPYQKPSGWLHRMHQLPGDLQLIGNIGQILPWKNQWDYLLVAEQLLHKNNRLHFFFVGTVVNQAYFDKLNQHICHLGLEDYFTFTGHTDHISKYLTEFDIILHTAINEPFGRVLIEAASSMKTVIAYASGGPSEIIKNGETGYLIADGKIDEMARITARLLKTPSQLESIGQSAHKHIIRNFNSVNYAHNVYQILTND